MTSTDAQVRTVMTERSKGRTQQQAAVKANLNSRTTVRKYERLGQLPSELRRWARTHSFTTMLHRHRLFLAVTLGIAIGLVNFYIQSNFRLPNDFSIPLCGARHLAAGLNPYTCPTEGQPSNPLTTVIALLPLAWLPDKVASAVIMAVSTGLLAYALNRREEPWRLLTFISVPFVYSVQISQWAPLFLAAVYLEWLYPIVLVKPQLGISVGVMNFARRRLIVVLALGLLTFLIQPNWILLWWPQSVNYSGFVPVLSIPGVLLLIALIRWRTKPAQWLLLLSLTPQRSWYDQLMLWVIPSTKRQMILLTVCSWVMWLPLILFGVHVLGAYDNLWIVISLFYPALAIVLANKETLQTEPRVEPI